MSRIEARLKSVSEAHQSEKRDLVALHTKLSQGHSQEGDEMGSSLKSRLMSLSTRQKQLLQCFVKQKEMSRQLAKLVERETGTKRTGNLCANWHVISGFHLGGGGVCPLGC